MDELVERVTRLRNTIRAAKVKQSIRTQAEDLLVYAETLAAAEEEDESEDCE